MPLVQSDGDKKKLVVLLVILVLAGAGFLLYRMTSGPAEPTAAQKQAQDALTEKLKAANKNNPPPPETPVNPTGVKPTRAQPVGK